MKIIDIGNNRYLLRYRINEELVNKYSTKDIVGALHCDKIIRDLGDGELYVADLIPSLNYKIVKEGKK